MKMLNKIKNHGFDLSGSSIQFVKGGGDGGFSGEDTGAIGTGNGSGEKGNG